MKRTLVLRLVASLAAAGTLGACYANPRPRVGVAYVVRQPPAERVEVVPASPGVEYVWVKGHWAWRRDSYEWIPGYWTVPARGYRAWVPGRWERDGRGWFFIEGHWR